jgi:CMP-N,N'-diacetyllegionaminic acid synthase
MIDGKSVLAVILARGGSKGIPRKNVLDLNGKPVIAWTIGAAKNSVYVDRTILSSDDDEIMDVARKWKCEAPFVRPSHLAQDESTSVDSLLHAVAAIQEEYDYLILLQPTSPLRTTEDIDSCLEICARRRAPACVSVTESNKSPAWMYILDKDDLMQPVLGKSTNITRRQDLPVVHVLNGAVYVAETEWFLEHKSFLSAQTLAYKMPGPRSLDIDTASDLVVAEALLNGSSD